MSGVFVQAVEPQAMAVSLVLAQRVRDHFKNPDNRSEFEEWYFKKYGKPYKWKKVRSKGGKKKRSV